MVVVVVVALCRAKETDIPPPLLLPPPPLILATGVPKKKKVNPRGHPNKNISSSERQKVGTTSQILRQKAWSGRHSLSAVFAFCLEHGYVRSRDTYHFPGTVLTASGPLRVHQNIGCRERSSLLGVSGSCSRYVGVSGKTQLCDDAIRHLSVHQTAESWLT